MTKTSSPVCVRERDEGNAELVGILAAISVVSRRLARRLAALDRKQAEKTKGGIRDEQDG